MCVLGLVVVRCYSIAEWFDAEFRGEVTRHLEYAQTIDPYTRLFGRECVTVWLDEELRDSPEASIG